jgi:lysophospholipase L1-like esterase
MLKKLLSALAQAWVIFGITLLLLLLADQGVRALLADPAAATLQIPGSHAPARERAAAVAGNDWIDRYWSEHAQSRHADWHSYVYWRRRPFAGAIINVDANGFRVTPHVQADAQRTIWLFGGSTVWGTGNRDSGTLAAQLEQVYHERSPELGVRVLNFGESGYVSRQSLIAFQSALACPQNPADLAIFLDGANDVFATLQSGSAGLPQNEDNRSREFNSSRQFPLLLRALALRLEGIARLASSAPAPLTGTELDALAAATAQNYLSQVRQAHSVGAGYGVDVLYAWQPTVFDRSPARADESAIVGASPEAHVRLQRSTRSALQAAISADPALPLQDLGGVFDADPEPLYFDFVHLSEAGQRRLAEKLHELSKDRLQLRTAHPAGLDQCRDRPLG